MKVERTTPTQFTIHGQEGTGAMATAVSLRAARLPATVSARLLAADEPLTVVVRSLSTNAVPVLITTSAPMAPEEQLAWPVVVARARHAATIALGAANRDYQIEVRVGRVGAPARDHGALLTAMIVAALTGTKFQTGTTVLGSISDVGVIGPVVRAGVSVDDFIGFARVGVPRGQGLPQPPSTTVPIDNLSDAFAILAGRALPQAKPASDTQLALSSTETEIVSRAYVELRSRHSTALANVVVAARRSTHPARVIAEASMAVAELTRAEAAHAAMHPLTALAQLRLAVVHAETYACTDAYLAATLRRDRSTMNALLSQSTARIVTGGQLAAADRLDRRIGALRVDSVGDALRLVSAYEAWHEMFGLGLHASALLGPLGPAINSLMASASPISNRSTEFSNVALMVMEMCHALSSQDAAHDVANQRLEQEATTSARISVTATGVDADNATWRVTQAHEWADASLDRHPATTHESMGSQTALAAARHISSALQEATESPTRALLLRKISGSDVATALRSFAALRATSTPLHLRELDAATDVELAALVVRAGDQARRHAQFALGAAGAVPLQSRLAIATATHRATDVRAELRGAYADYQRAIAYAAMAVVFATR